MEFHIIPEPAFMSVENGNTVFKLTYLANISFDSDSKKANDSLLSFIKKVFELEPLGTGRESVILSVDGSIGKSEAYNLTVEEDCVRITGADSAGVFYGVQTFIQLLLQGELCLPALSIKDEPQFEYRGFMLDVSRYFFTVEAVKLFLDAMALHKLNRFHIHLTDDQGWRFEVKALPELAKKGSYRPYTIMGHNTGMGEGMEMSIMDDTPEEGYYTQAQLKELEFGWKIVKHIKSNAIAVVKDNHTIGGGAGQTNRVGSADIALNEAKNAGFTEGLILASDGFLPFGDTVALAAQYGVTAIVQPGGSIRDEESIQKADELGITMLFTGVRHFKH